MAESLDVLRDMMGVEKKQKAPSLDELRQKAGVEKGYLESAYDYVTGAESEGYPELGTSGPSVPALVGNESAYDLSSGTPPFKNLEPGTIGEAMSPVGLNPKGVKMAGAYATQVDPKAIADIATKTLKDIDPNVEQGTDKYGNPTINFEGQTYYVNAPGMSEADLFQFLGQLGAYAPATRAGATARGILGRMVKTGFLSAGTSAGLDAIGGAMGSEQGIDLERAMLTGVIGGAMEGIAPALKTIWRNIFRTPKYFDSSTGKLTAEGVEAARNAGLDPVDMERRLASAFAEEIVDEPVPALAKTRAYEKAYGIPYTRGQQLAQLDDFSQAAREEGMRHGTRGAESQQGIRLIDKKAAEKAESAVDDVLGGRKIETIQEGGETITSGVQGAERAKAAAVDKAYDVAAPFTSEARINRSNISSLMKDVKKGLSELGLDPESHPKTVATLRRLAGLSKKAKKGDRLNINEVNLGRFERERRILNTKIRNTKGEDLNALVQVRDALDDWLEKSFDDALFEGDPEALKALKNARQEAFEYHSLFGKKKGDEAGAVIEKLLRNDPTPEQAVNYIFGAGTKLKQGSAKAVTRLKDILGEDSDGWLALREMGWHRLTRDPTGSMKSPTMFVKQFDETMNQNKSVMEAMYSPEELQIMKSVRDAVAAMRTPKRATQESKTSYTLIRAMRDLIRRGGTTATFSGRPMLGGALFTIGRSIPAAGPLLQTSAVKRAAKQIPRPAPSSPPTVAAAIAGSRIAQPQE